MKKNLKNMGGRPTKYGEDIIRRSEEYINSCVDDLENKKVNLPKAEGLAFYLKVSRSTLYEWGRNYKEFSHILESLNQIQVNRVINEALAGNYNANIAKLLLGKHGYSDKQESSSSINLSTPIYGGLSTDTQEKGNAINR